MLSSIEIPAGYEEFHRLWLSAQKVLEECRVQPHRFEKGNTTKGWRIFDCVITFSIPHSDDPESPNRRYTSSSVWMLESGTCLHVTMAADATGTVTELDKVFIVRENWDEAWQMVNLKIIGGHIWRTAANPVATLQTYLRSLGGNQRVRRSTTWQQLI